MRIVENVKAEEVGIRWREHAGPGRAGVRAVEYQSAVADGPERIPVHSGEDEKRCDDIACLLRRAEIDA